ncbi:MAG: hypothetical protein Q9204_004910 [Flavoplaca sp. TL-2023a]
MAEAKIPEHFLGLPKSVIEKLPVLEFPTEEMLAELEAWHALCQLEVELDEHLIDFRSFLKAFDERASNIQHLASLEDQHHGAALMFLEGFRGGKNKVEDLQKETEALGRRTSRKADDYLKQKYGYGGWS